MIRAGSWLTVTDTGQRVCIWSAAPGPGRYWAHLGRQVVLIEVHQRANATDPTVTLLEEQS